MGCGSSKSTGENPAKRSKKKMANNEIVNGNYGKENKIPVTNTLPKKEAQQMADLPGAVPEIESELMPKPISFEISTKDEIEESKESIIKKHPPKRIQKLEEKPEVTNNRIHEKQMSARERRSQHLQERIQSSKRSRRGTARSALPPKLEPTIHEQREA